MGNNKQSNSVIKLHLYTVISKFQVTKIGRIALCSIKLALGTRCFSIT